MNHVHVSTESKQDYITPSNFVKLCAKSFGVTLIVDFAADDRNFRCPIFYTEQDSSLKFDWGRILEHLNLKSNPLNGFKNPAGWLNPPFKHCAPFMSKAVEAGEQRQKVITLTLSSLGTNWYKKYVKPYAASFILEERMTFMGQTTPYPKELMVSLYGFGYTGLGWWSWEKEMQDAL